jgi:hypothetical protein
LFFELWSCGGFFIVFVRRWILSTTMLRKQARCVVRACWLPRGSRKDDLRGKNRKPQHPTTRCVVFLAGSSVNENKDLALISASSSVPTLLTRVFCKLLRILTNEETVWGSTQVAFFLGLMPLLVAWIYSEILEFRKLRFASKA